MVMMMGEDEAKPTRVVSSSVTRREIERFWRRKRIVEDDHLLSAIKAAARIKARYFTEEDYRRFEESVNESIEMKVGHEDEGSLDEIRVGIKDWWTKSKYAYLNQPAAERERRSSSSYKPNIICFYNTPSSPLFPSSIKPVFFSPKNIEPVF